MPVLHLGEIDVPYADPAQPKRVRKARPGKQRPLGKSQGGARTTVEVAKILEAKFSVFSGFYDLHSQDIADAAAESMRDALDTVMAGGPKPANPLAGLEEDVDEMFRDFLDREELAQVEAGVPTKAALKGVNHRLAHPYAKGNPRRPSFEDTGGVYAAFKAWVD